MDSTLTPGARWGVSPGYDDIDGRWVPADPATVARVLAAMGATDGGPPDPPLVFAGVGQALRLDEPAEVLTEDGATVPAEQGLPGGLPAGYHRLRRLRDGAIRRLVVSPGRCHLAPELRAWGWAAQLYAVRSRRSWGIGDLADLRELAAWAAGLGAAALLVNPLDAPLPVVPQERSPYYPSSRRYRNPLYIRVEEAPGAERLGERLAPLARAARALNERRLINRDAVFDLKMQALRELHQAFSGSPDYDRYRSREGQDVDDYATFCALSEVHGVPWRDWPEDLKRPWSASVRRFREAEPGRVDFHRWLQWLLDRQLAEAGAECGLVHDLPIGVQADGADSWAWPEAFAEGVSVGAPPDPFNRAGQDWAVPPFDPWRLRAAGYEPFIKTVRAAVRHGAGLRVDHVMGLFRLYWIPAGMGPEHGVYVRYPYGELLDILALESQRAGALVVGEDLGTVQPWVREELGRRLVLSHRLLWFEEQPPADYRPESLAALGTHDLPTLAGVWEGSDSDPSIRERLRRYAGVSDDRTTAEVAEAAYRALAASPSRLVAASLEDALGVVERPNRPGTTWEWPNWSLALPETLEELCRDPRPARLAELLRR
ncbi:MAG TPA: 4-alpha-glucanotransferase [Candidatus Dormibacteraeota bacterium]|nr:4-alpha-glucanotransferase [Candidatus Dormibacteraeota bacterium]